MAISIRLGFFILGVVFKVFSNITIENILVIISRGINLMLFSRVFIISILIYIIILVFFGIFGRNRV